MDNSVSIVPIVSNGSKLFQVVSNYFRLLQLVSECLIFFGVKFQINGLTDPKSEIVNHYSEFIIYF